MKNFKLIPTPLFDTLDHIIAETPNSIKKYLQSLELNNVFDEHKVSIDFLKSYSGSPDTFNSYRREVERILHWSWLIAKKSLKNINREDIRNYLEFCRKPPSNWISTKNVSRFLTNNGERIPNSEWKPFVAKVPKAQRKIGNIPKINEYLLSNKSLAGIMSVTSTFFTFLQQEGYLEVNPMQLVRQKSHYIQREQSHKITRKLSHLQWKYVIETVENLANNNLEYERHLFLISMFYLLGLRISELSDTRRHIPRMGDFAPDKESRWWFTTVGKGNKTRDIAVPDVLLEVLKRYRKVLGLTPLPTRGELSPLIAKQRGFGNLGTRQIRNLVQTCFDQAILSLRKAGKDDEAADLETATVHWLRHTSISVDVEHRPREHVRDDAGHESAVITDHYIDIDRAARHDSAKSKKLK